MEPPEEQNPPHGASGSRPRCSQDADTILAHLPDVYWTVDGTGRLLYISPNAAPLWGYSMDEIRREGMGLLARIIHPDDAERVTASYRKLHAGGSPFDAEYRIKRRDGTWAWVRDRVLHIYRRDGTDCIDGLTADITTYKQTESELRSSEERFRILAEATAAAVFIHRGGKFLYFNSATELLSGYTRAQLESLNFLDVVHPDFKALVMERAAARLAGRAVPPRYEIKVVGSDGTEKWLELNNKVIEFEGAPAVLGTAFDITERKEKDAALRESEERYRSLVKASPDAIAIIDPSGTVRFVSERAVALFRAGSNTGLVGRDVYSLLAADERESAWPRISTVLESGGTGPLEFTVIRSDGEPLLCEVHVSRYSGAGGTPGGYILTLHDITQRRQAENLIRASLKEKEVMLQEIHHRVKNNLQVITSLLSLQARRIPDRRIADCFNDSRNRVHAMALVHQQLYQSTSLARIDFDQYIRSIARELYRIYGTDAGRIILNVESGGVSLNIDQAIPCGLVINELLSNALKYAFPDSRPGRGTITVGLRENSIREDGARRYTLSVRDDGVGMPPEFDIAKAESLGLQLVTLLAEGQLNGGVEMSRENGTAFTIIIVEPPARA